MLLFRRVFGERMRFLHINLTFAEGAFDRKRSDGGQALLEFALVLPFLLLVFLGILDLGRVYFEVIGLTSAAREGVRYLSVHPEDVDNMFYGTESITIREAGYSGIVLTPAQVTPSCVNADDEPEYCDSGRPATVTVEHEFELVLGWFLPNPIQITRTAEMVVP